MKRINPKMQAKMKEALVAVLPIAVIVLLLSFTIAPLTPSILLSFLLGSVLAMVAMTPLITIQIMGVIHQVKNRKRISAAVPVPALDEDAIIEL